MEVHRLALPKGFRLANYELTRVLGKGGFGITYLGVDRHLGRKVAVKELMPDTIVTRIEDQQVVAQTESLSTNWEWAKERFLEEARVLASFQHPNIVEVHQLIEANGTVYMVMDYIEGESYEARLRRIGHEPDEHSMRLLIEPLMDGLEEVHSAGLLHRDIKPDNILLRRGIQPILLDFGSARKLLEGTAVMTSLVTHGYSPIEQYQIKGKQGPWTDIYALAAVAVRALTGEKPPMSADRMSEDDFVWLSYRGLEGFSPLFLQALDWALRVKPKERPQNIREWRASFGWEPRPTFRSKLPLPTPPTTPTSSTTLHDDKTAVAMAEEKNTPERKPTARFTPKPRLEPPPAIPRPKPERPELQPEPEDSPAAAASSSLDAAPPSALPASKSLVGPVLAVMAVMVGLLYITFRGRPTPAEANAPKAAPIRETVPAVPKARYTPFVNRLGMKFAPVPGTHLLFSVWDTRVKDYRAFVQATGRPWRAPSFAQTPDEPAVNVTWEDAQAFCRWLSEREGRPYRLPTDAEWSLAVGLQGETGATPREKDSRIKNAYPWGTDWPPPARAGNYGVSRFFPADAYEKTSPVGSFDENPYGLFDMGGNVWQWCEDWYDTSLRRRVLRGAAWNSSTQDILRSSFRYYNSPNEASDNIGFRCVTPADGKPETP